MDKAAFGEYVHDLENEAAGIGLKPGWVPVTKYILVNDQGEYVGIFNLRHELNDALMEGAGHIGYGIAPEWRGRGYATEGLRLLLIKARDEFGNCSGMGGKTNCGVLSYAYVDAEMADYVVAVTDCLVDYPNYPAEINQTKVDYVCVVDQIGIPEKIATGAAKPTTDQRKILMAEYCTQVVANTPYFKDGFSYQTGVGGASIASTISLSKIMEEKNIHMGLGVGGLTKPMCELLDRGLARKLVDTQDFDLDAVNNVRTNPNHFPISAGEYASPMNKGAFVNKLDYVILASLEVDTHFNCNVVVGSDGIITGAQGGHPDTAQGAKCTIVIAPLLQGRIPAICTDVTTVTTPGESVDIVVTDYGVAVNPRRPDLLEALKAADCVPLKTIEELRDIAYSIGCQLPRRHPDVGARDLPDRRSRCTHDMEQLAYGRH